MTKLYQSGEAGGHGGAAGGGGSASGGKGPKIEEVD